MEREGGREEKVKKTSGGQLILDAQLSLSSAGGNKAERVSFFSFLFPSFTQASIS